MSWYRTAWFAVGAITLPLLFVSSIGTGKPDTDDGRSARNRYIGAKACKNCHSSEAKGKQYQIWADSHHAKAFETLATPKAKEIAAKAGVANPQKSDSCLKCHVTAHDANKRDLKRGFDHELGVQCEACHGPGEEHAKKRFAEASSGKVDADSFVQIPADEIVAAPKMETCLECHSPDGPTFKPFCYKERNAAIEHLDPRKERTEEELKARKCGCGEDCKCAQGECSKQK